MLKPGICTIEQEGSAFLRWCRAQPAANLLALPGDGPRFDRLMERVSLSNGVARTTGTGRLAEVDNMSLAVLLETFGPSGPIDVEDFAISNGITALEFYTCLAGRFEAMRFRATDWYLYLVEAKTRYGTYIIDSDGVPIQFIRPPFVVGFVHKLHWVYVINNVIHRRYARIWDEEFREAFQLPEAWDRKLDRPVPAARLPGLELNRIPLIRPDVLGHLSPNFRIERQSIFEPLAKPVDVIRTMNILNDVYFSQDQLKTAIESIGKSLKPGGIWIVGRTPMERPTEHSVSYYRKTESGWALLRRIRDGSELEPLLATIGRA